MSLDLDGVLSKSAAICPSCRNSSIQTFGNYEGKAVYFLCQHCKYKWSLVRRNGRWEENQPSAPKKKIK